MHWCLYMHLVTWKTPRPKKTKQKQIQKQKQTKQNKKTRRGREQVGLAK